MTSLSETPAAASAVIETTTAQFRQDVLAASMQQVVLVDFWAPWCGCHRVQERSTGGWFHGGGAGKPDQSLY